MSLYEKHVTLKFTVLSGMDRAHVAFVGAHVNLHLRQSCAMVNSVGAGKKQQPSGPRPRCGQSTVPSIGDLYGGVFKFVLATVTAQRICAAPRLPGLFARSRLPAAALRVCRVARAASSCCARNYLPPWPARIRDRNPASPGLPPLARLCQVRFRRYQVRLRIGQIGLRLQQRSLNSEGSICAITCFFYV